MNKKFYLLILITFFGCTSFSTIPLTPKHKLEGGNITLVSFIRDNPTYYINGEPYKKPALKNKKNKYDDLKDLDDPVEKKKKKRRKSSKSNKFSDLEDEETSDKDLTLNRAFPMVGINRYLMKYFIIHFRKKSSRFKIKHNLKASKKRVSFVAGYNTDGFSPQKMDRNFKPIRKMLNSSLVLELRVLKLEIAQDLTDPNSGFFATYGVLISVKGILYDLKSKRKIWESVDIERWLDADYILFSNLTENGAKKLIGFYKDLCYKVAEALVDSFFE